MSVIILEKAITLKMPDFKILSIDGGGIRGIVPAQLLSRISAEIGSNKLSDYFDLITGTSTGGIIALAIGAGLSMEDIVYFYEHQGKKIFSRSALGAPILRNSYRISNLEKTLRSIFGDRRIAEAHCRLCIPSIDLVEGKIVVFKTPHHENYIYDKYRYFWEVAAATSAAPIYFAPSKIKTVGTFVDGGLWANNPILVGIAEARRLGIQLDDIKVLSLGTGTHAITEKSLWNWAGGAAKWRTKIVDLTFQSQSQSSHFTASYLLPVENYDRLDVSLDSNIKLDSVGNNDYLVTLANTAFKNRFISIKDKYFTTTTEKGF